MQFQGIMIAIGLFDLVIQSIALFIISGKLGWKKRWKAWIPGLRFYALGQSVAMSKDGLYSGIMDLLTVISMILLIFVRRGQLGVLMNLLQLVFFVFYFIYRIRIFLQILRLFNMKRTWIILWVIANWLPLMILGISKKYQPEWDLILEEDLDAGEKPAQIPETREIPFVPTNEGLSVPCLVKTTTTAMTVMPFLLIFQLIFSGGFFDLGSADFLKVTTISHWGMDSMCTISRFNDLPMVTLWNTVVRFKDVDIGGVQPLQSVVAMVEDQNGVDAFMKWSGEQSANPAYEAVASNVWFCFLMLLLMIVLFAVVSVIALKLVDRDKR